MKPSDRVARTGSYLLLGVLIVVVMIAAEQFLIPLTWAFIFAFIVLPLARRMEARRFPRPVASILSTLVFLVVSTMIMIFLVYQSLHILKNENILDS